MAGEEVNCKVPSSDLYYRLAYDCSILTRAGSRTEIITHIHTRVYMYIYVYKEKKAICREENKRRAAIYCIDYIDKCR